VSASQCMRHCRGLMRVELLDTAGVEHGPQPVIYAVWAPGVSGRASLEHPDGSYPRVRGVWTFQDAACQPVEHGLQLSIPATLGAQR